MNEVQTHVLAVLDANGGNADWQTLVDATDYQKRQELFMNVRALEQTGHVKRTVAIDAQTGKSLLTISKVGE